MLLQVAKVVLDMRMRALCHFSGEKGRSLTTEEWKVGHTAARAVYLAHTSPTTSSV